MDLLAVDHVQFAVPDLAAATRHLTEHGYSVAFTARGFDSLPRPWFHGTGKDMVYLQRGSSRIELINAAGNLPATRYTPIFGSPIKATEAHADNLDDTAAKDFVWQAALAAHCAFAPGGGDGLHSVILHAAEADASAAFWQQLGFVSRRAGSSGDTMLAFPSSIISMPLTLRIRTASSAAPSAAKADAAGCSVIALLTRNIAADGATLAQAGHAVTETASLRINQRDLTIGFVTGPSGELVELIEFRSHR